MLILELRQLYLQASESFRFTFIIRTLHKCVATWDSSTLSEVVCPPGSSAVSLLPYNPRNKHQSLLLVVTVSSAKLVIIMLPPLKGKKQKLNHNYSFDEVLGLTWTFCEIIYKVDSEVTI